MADLKSLLVENYWELLPKRSSVSWAPHEVALVEIDPYHQKTVADFLITARRLGHSDRRYSRNPAIRPQVVRSGRSDRADLQPRDRG